MWYTSLTGGPNTDAPKVFEAKYPGVKLEVYRGDSDANDLRQLTARFNTWADRNNVTSYTAFVATPYAFSADLGADVLWIGGWPNGTQMGTNETLWQAQGGEVSAAFDALVECNSHSLYAEVIVNQPSGPPPENGVAMFEDCTVHEGRTDAEIGRAHV